jgi:hypothetical protein
MKAVNFFGGIDYIYRRGSTGEGPEEIRVRTARPEPRKTILFHAGYDFYYMIGGLYSLEGSYDLKGEE